MAYLAVGTRTANVDDAAAVDINQLQYNFDALLDGSKDFADQGFESGAVLSFDSGDMLITHSSNALAITGGNVGIGTSAALTEKLSIGDATEQTTLAIRGKSTDANTTPAIALIRNSAWYISTPAVDGTLFSIGYNTATYSDANLLTASKFIIDSSGNVGIGGSAVRGTTAGTAHLDLYNGTAPAGTLTNGVSFYSSAGEAYVMDAAGNATLLSPHDEENNWIFRSKDTTTGKVLKIDMEKMMKFLNDKFGTDFIHEYMEAV